MTTTEQFNLLKKEHIVILQELLDTLKGIESCEPHFTNRRRIAEVEAKIALAGKGAE
jgi:hypothetical protein